MAIYRSIQMTFWTDTKIVDEFTPEDKYFYLYLFTNPHTNLVGCYEVSIKQMANELGYNADTVERLLKRFSETHKVADYSNETKEVLLVNWHKYNWTSSEKLRKPLEKEIASIKNKEFRDYLMSLYKNNDTVSIPYRYPIDTSVTVTNTNTNTNAIYINSSIDKKESYIEQVREVIDYLNLKTDKKYSTRGKANVNHIKARLKEGFTVSDFKEVIDKKCAAWLKDEKMCVYLRPETLFCAKHFESYLNEIENDATKRKREDTEINARQREEIRKSCEIGFY